MRKALLLAQSPSERTQEIMEWVGLAVLLVGLIALGFWFVWRVRSEVTDKPNPDQPELDSYRELLDRGDLDPGEFERIQNLLKDAERDR